MTIIYISICGPINGNVYGSCSLGGKFQENHYQGIAGEYFLEKPQHQTGKKRDAPKR